jgi:hypothetical protein
MRLRSGLTAYILPIVTGITFLIFPVTPLAAQPAKPAPGKTASSPGSIVMARPVPATERRIYIPYRSWSTLLQKNDPAIFLPYSEYQQLLKQAAQSVTIGKPKPPVNAVVTEAHYIAKVEKGFARITGTLTVKTLIDGWAEVPLAFQGAAIGKMTCTDDEAILRGAGAGRYSLLLSKRGTHSVVLELSVKVAGGPDGSVFELGCPSVGISTFDVSIPKTGQGITVSPQLIVIPGPAPAAETSRIKVSVGSTTRLSARWTPQVKTPTAQIALATVAHLSHVTIRESLILNETTLNYEVRRGSLKQLLLAVPLNDRILSVTGPVAKVSGWTTKKEANRQLVTVSLSEPLTGRLALQVRTERPLKGEKYSIAGVEEDGTPHGVHAVGVARENGFLVIEHDESMTLDIERQTGWLRATAAELSQTERRKNALYVRFFNANSPLAVTSHPVKPRVIAKQEARFTYDEEGVRLTTNIDYKIERVGTFELKIRVPEGLEIDGVTSAGMKEFVKETEGNNQVLKILFERKIIGSHRVIVSGYQKIDPKDREKTQPVSLLEPMGTELETGRLLFYAPPSLTVVVENTGLIGVQPAANSAAPAVPGVRLVSAWEYHRRPVKMNVRVASVPTRLTARLTTAIDARETTTQIRSQLEFHVEHSPIRRFRFLVPKSIAAGLRINDTQNQSVPFRVTAPPTPAKKTDNKPAPEKKIIQKKEPVKKEEPEPDGEWSLITIELPKPVLGRVTFLVRYDISAEEEEAKPDGPKERKLEIRPLRVLLPATDDSVAVTELLAEISVSGDRSLKISSQATGGDVETIDSRELQIVQKTDGNFYRYHKESISLKLHAVKLTIQPVIETVVSKALVEVMIGSDHTATYRCRYRLVSSERQRLRIDFPKTAEPLATLVNGRKVDLELAAGDPGGKKGPEEEEFLGYLVNVSRPGSSDQSFTIVLQFRVPINPKPFEAASGKIQLFLPKLGGGAKTTQVVQELRTAVWVPREMALIGKVDNFRRRTWTKLTGLLPHQFVADRHTDTLQDWIGVEPGGFDFPTDGHVYRFDNLGGSDRIEVTYADLAFATWMLSIPLLLIGLVLAKTSWENKIGVVLLATFAATMMSLKDIDWVYHGFFIARYGLAVMLAWWCIHALFAAKSSGKQSTSPPDFPSRPQMISATAVIPPPGIFDSVMKRPSSTNKNSEPPEQEKSS